MQNTATVRPDGTGVVTIDGQEPTRITGHSVEDTRRALLGHVIEHARRTGQHVDVLARDPEAEHRLRVHPDGRVQPLPAQVPPAPATPVPQPTTTATPPVQIQPAPQPTPNGTASVPTPAPRREASPMTQTEQPIQTRREARERSFLADARMSAPPPTGWQAFLARLGIKSGPSPEEISKWEDERAISQHWPGPRTIAVLNGKGGAGKTPATALLSAMFARAGGSGVLAWDNNVTRGTLGWRTESGPHEATVLDLIPRTDELGSFRWDADIVCTGRPEAACEGILRSRSGPWRLSDDSLSGPAASPACAEGPEGMRRPRGACLRAGSRRGLIRVLWGCPRLRPPGEALAAAAGCTPW